MRAVIERVTPDRVSGWAVDDNRPSERLTVRLLISKKPVMESRAENFRPDLLKNNLGDGRYGYIIQTDRSNKILQRYLCHEIVVEVENAHGERMVAEPVDGLYSQVREAVFLENMELMEFGDFLGSITPETLPTSAEAAARLLGVLNASRAHFPGWYRSVDFAALTVKLAEIANLPHTLSFYKELLNRTERASDEDPIQYDPTPPVPFRSSYGSLTDWIANRPEAALRIVHPLWPSFAPAEEVSFLEEVGLLTSDHACSDAIPVLAFREYTFGDFSWYVRQLGKREPAARSLYYLNFEQLRSIIDDGGVIIIDASNEGAIAEPFWIELLNDALRKLAVPTGQVLYVSFNLRFGAAPDQRAFSGHVEHANYFISAGIKVLKNQYPSDRAIRDHCNHIINARRAAPRAQLRHYICMNFTPRWARWAVALHLSLNDLLKKGFVSFPGKTNSKIKDDAREFNQLEHSFPNLAHRADLLAHIPEFLAKCPLMLDVEATREQPPDFEFPLDLFTRSLIHIVTETHVTWGIGSHAITEKVLKPIVGLQPFIVVGNPQSLAMIEELGFLTFKGLLDESYDAISDPAKRLDAIFGEIDRLTSASIGDLRSAVDGMTETLVHNFVHLLSIGPLLFGAAIENRLRRTMLQMRGRNMAA